MKSLTTGVFAAALAIASVGALALPAAASAATLDWSHTRTGHYGGQITVNASCATGAGCERTKTNVGVLGSNATSTKVTTAGGGNGYTKSVNVSASTWSFSRFFSWL